MMQCAPMPNTRIRLCCYAMSVVIALIAINAQAYNNADIPIRPGDHISIVMAEDPDVQYNGEVDASGYVNLPYLGEVRVAGSTETVCSLHIKTTLESDFYQRATVTARVIKRSPGVVYVYGAVKNPGPINLPIIGNMTILQAVSHVNGITAWASPDQCTVTRSNPVTGEREKITVDLIESFQDIGGPADINLIAEDVIFVPSANTELAQVLSNEPYEVIVVGQVNQPGIILFAPGELRTFMRAIFKAGNFTRFAKKKAVRVIRYRKDKERDVREVDAAKMIDEGFMEYDFELEPGDMIIVDEKMINF